MARHDTLTIPPQTWTQLTNADADAVRVQSRSGQVFLQATAGATAPASAHSGFGGALLFDYADTITAALVLADAFPGVTGANRLWAWCEGQCTLSVSHADA